MLPTSWTVCYLAVWNLGQSFHYFFVTENFTPAERNQMMGHSRSSIYQSYYQRRLHPDIQSTYLGGPVQRDHHRAAEEETMNLYLRQELSPELARVLEVLFPATANTEQNPVDARHIKTNALDCLTALCRTR